MTLSPTLSAYKCMHEECCQVLSRMILNNFMMQILLEFNNTGTMLTKGRSLASCLILMYPTLLKQWYGVRSVSW